MGYRLRLVVNRSIKPVICFNGGATVARRRPQRGLDGGATVAASFSRVARRWLPPFRLLFGGGARPATLTSWMEA